MATSDQYPPLTDDIREAVSILGDPRTMGLNAQHDRLLQQTNQLLELARLGGFDARVIPIAGAAAVVAHTAHLSASDRKQIADALRESAAEIEATAVRPTH